MAETDAAEPAGKGGLAFLRQKAGPLPLGIWLLAGAGAWWILQRKKASAGSGPQTDPAGNTGTIDPATGFVYGSPEDQAALNAANSSGGGGSSDGGNAGQNATSGAQTYADNEAWGRAAVNFLVGLGIDASTANQAIQLYLSSQPLTVSQQGDVNLAIQALGAPPTLPGPITGNPLPVTTPPGTTPPPGHGVNGKPVTAPPGTKPPVSKPPGPRKGPTASVPTGLAVSSKKSTSLNVKWNRARNATGYHVLCTDMGTKRIAGESTVQSTTATFGNLTPSHSYVVDVWAEPEAGAPGTGPHARVSATLPRTG